MIVVDNESAAVAERGLRLIYNGSSPVDAQNENRYVTKRDFKGDAMNRNTSVISSSVREKAAGGLVARATR